MLEFVDMRKKKILLSWAAFLLLAVGVLWCYSSRNQESKMIPLPEGGKVVEPSLGGSTPQPLPVKPLDLSPEAIANWSVCRNEKYGYEFKYPRGWYIYDTSQAYETGMPMSSRVFECNSSSLMIHQQLLIGQRFDPPSLWSAVVSKETWKLLTTPSPNHTESDLKKVVFKKSILNGEEIEYYTDADNFRVAFPHKDKFLVFSESLGQKGFLEAVLSTFRFIDRKNI